MAYSTRDAGAVTILSVEGKMNEEFLPVVDGLLPGKAQLVCDLGQAVGLRGDDLENLVAAHHRCNDASGRFVLANLPDDLTYILDLMELDEFFTVAETVDQAVEMLSATGDEMPMTTMQMIAFQRDRILSESAILEIADPEEAARARVERVKACIRYLAPTPERIDLLTWLSAVGGDVDPDEVASEGGFDRVGLDAALERLEGIRILRRKKDGTLIYDPAPQAAASIKDILVMWADHANRPKMMEWARA